jgi:hypothetical protein
MKVQAGEGGGVGRGVFTLHLGCCSCRCGGREPDGCLGSCGLGRRGVRELGRWECWYGSEVEVGLREAWWLELVIEEVAGMGGVAAQAMLR